MTPGLHDKCITNVYSQIPVEGIVVTGWAGLKGTPLAIPESFFSVRPESLQDPESGEMELRTDDPEGMLLA